MSAGKQGKLKQAELKSLPAGQHYDGGGLFFEPDGTGNGVFRCSYRLNGNKRTYTIGWLDEVSLTQARAEHRNVQTLVDRGIDPVADRKRREAEQMAATIASLNAKDDSLESWMRAWMKSEINKGNWSERHGRKIRERIDKHLAREPLYKMHVADIKPGAIAPVLEKIAETVPDTAHRIAGYISSTFVYAAAYGREVSDPAAVARKVLKRRRNSKKERTPQPAIIDLPELGEVLLNAERSDSVRALREASVLVAYTCQRAERIVSATFDQFDFAKRLWRIPRSLMKTKDPNRNSHHELYLCDTVMAMLKRLPKPEKPTAFLFPSEASKHGHITIEGLEKFYQNLGLKGRHVPHGWRSALMTNANEAMSVNQRGEPIHRFAASDSHAVLDHELGEKLQRAYDRGERREWKKILLTWWGEQLDAARQAVLDREQNRVRPLRRVAR